MLPTAKTLSLDTLHALQQQYFPPRPVDAHKGLYGPLVCVGGGVGYSGAIVLSASTALRSGAGTVLLATSAQTAQSAFLYQPELMARAVHDRADLSPLLANAKALLIGPGLGRDDWARGLWPSLTGLPQPQVLDADALFWLADNPDQHNNRIITPHPGEAARLLGTDITQVQADRIASIVRLQELVGGVVILKGANSLVFDGESLWCCPFGNPGMATAGMGDVLAGLLAALLAQNVPLMPAALLAVAWHALAADELVQQHGEHGLLASDLPAVLRRWVNHVQN
ncbi:MAG: NAD(P)H-hydrate dehydratase [Moraxellaceae bacterium]|nr:NAD(P)H-hydrate dehydratase [Moraxellaceae bacterium]